MKNPTDRPEVACPGCGAIQKGRLEEQDNKVTRWFCENIASNGTPACGVGIFGVKVTVFDEYQEYFTGDFQYEAQHNEHLSYESPGV